MTKCTLKLDLKDINSSDTLLKILEQTDISVPERGHDRNKYHNHTERYAIAHLLSTLAAADFLSYPLTLSSPKKEPPDFLLTLNTKKIGIEHTEAVHTNQASRAAQRERGKGPDMYFISHHQPGEPAKSKKELLKEIEANQPYNGWVGDSVEKEWAEAMCFFVGKKVKKLLTGSDRFEEDWLLIYDNLELPAPNIRQAAPFLLNRINGNKALNEFKRIYIITGKYILDISSVGIHFYNINDLWNHPA